MPEVLWPAGARIDTPVTLEQHEPGLISTDPPYGGPPLILHRGYAVWRLTLSVPAMRLESGGEEMEAFLQELGSRRDNWAEIPVGYPSIGPAPASVASIDASGTIATLTADPGSLRRGRWLRQGLRSYQVEHASGLDISWQPNAPLEALEPVGRFETMRARALAPIRTARGHRVLLPSTIQVEEYPFL